MKKKAEETRRLKILVVDDKEENRKSAQALLAGHELTVVGDYERAEKLLKPQVDRVKYDDLLVLRGLTEKSDWKLREAARQECIVFPDFDVALIDLLLPAGRNQMGDRGWQYVGKEMPIGIFLALLAARHGVKLVGVFSDQCHHDHPASACFDALNDNNEGAPLPLFVAKSKLVLCNCRNWIGCFQPNDFTKRVKYEQVRDGAPHVMAKEWNRILEYLLNLK